MPPAGGQRTSLTELVSTITGYQQRVVFGQSGVFSPGSPIAPVAKEPVRIFDFRVGENTFWTPRSSEAWSFQQLRNLVEPGGFDLARLAIETRKDQLERLDYQVRPIEVKKRKNQDPRIDELMKLMRRPDGVRDFATWTRRLLEDLFVIDAPAVEIRRNRGGKIIALEVVDGATFKLLIDDTGRAPAPPAPAYEQVIKGRPWALLTTDDLIYRPRNQRPAKIYGFSPVEQILTTIHMGLTRQLSQLNYFTDGTTPPGFLNAPEGWTPDQVKEYYDNLMAVLAGNLDARRRIWIAPAGSHYQPIKDAPLKDEFDEWIARVVCYAFSLPPTAFIRQLNRSSSETADDAATEEGLEPLKGWIKRWWDDVIQLRMGYDDLEFVWSDAVAIDPGVQATVDNLYLRNGTYCINDVLDRHGLDPIPNGNRRLIYTASGAVLLDTIVKSDDPASQPVGPSEPGEPSELEDGASQIAEDNSEPEVGKLATAPFAKSRRALTRAESSVRQRLAAFFAECAADVTRQIAAATTLGKSDNHDEAKALAIIAGLHLGDWSVLVAPLGDDLAAAFADGTRQGLDALDLGDGKTINAAREANGLPQVDDGDTEPEPEDGSAWGHGRAHTLVAQIHDNTPGMMEAAAAALIAGELADITAAPAFSDDRARMIARTEITNASRKGNIAAYRASGVATGKRWVTSGDDLVDEECQENEDAGAIGLDEDFPNGDMPHPWCRCSVEPVIEKH